jgi:hypothetical protein
MRRPGVDLDWSHGTTIRSDAMHLLSHLIHLHLDHLQHAHDQFRDDYLAHASDLADLERRQRDWRDH